MNKLISKLNIFLILVVISIPVAAQDMQDMMKKWQDYMTPGEMHKMMESSVGEWKTVNKMWMDPTATEPMVSEGTVTYEMILGGRYLLAKHVGIMMGMPMEGMNLLAYDNATKEFISVWIDNMGTGITTAKGTMDMETHKVTMFGSMIDPMTGQNLEYKQVQTIIDENNQVFEMFMIHEGHEFKSMEVISSR